LLIVECLKCRTNYPSFNDNLESYRNSRTYINDSKVDYYADGGQQSPKFMLQQKESKDFKQASVTEDNPTF
jgi:hypothetical protein